MRHLIELATGYYTGSYYFDGTLYNRGNRITTLSVVINLTILKLESICDTGNLSCKSCHSEKYYCTGIGWDEFIIIAMFFAHKQTNVSNGKWAFNQNVICHHKVIALICTLLKKFGLIQTVTQLAFGNDLLKSPELLCFVKFPNIFL